MGASLQLVIGRVGSACVSGGVRSQMNEHPLAPVERASSKANQRLEARPMMAKLRQPGGIRQAIGGGDHLLRVKK
jgi:hypothetical protein